MTWTMKVALLGGVLAQGCILYSDRRDHLPDPGEETETGDSATEPTDPKPSADVDLRLTVAEGLPGQNLLSSLVNAGQESVDLLSVDTVTFSRDVTVLDLLARTDEVVLLLAIDDEAAPGAVDISVTSIGGNGWILDLPFTVLDPDANPACPPPGGTSSSEDTGCP